MTISGKVTGGFNEYYPHYHIEVHASDLPIEDLKIIIMAKNDFEIIMGILSRQNQSRSIRTLKSGMVGIAPGQTARIHVVNVGPPDAVGKSVWGQGWRNPHSELLAQATFNLEGGASAFFDLNHDTVATAGQNRLQIRAAVTILDDPDCSCIATLEVFDTLSGRASLIFHLTES